MATAPKVITAEELDAMSPDQRAQVVREHIVTDLDHLPETFRHRVETTAACWLSSSDPSPSERPATGPRRPFVL